MSSLPPNFISSSTYRFDTLGSSAGLVVSMCLRSQVNTIARQTDRQTDSEECVAVLRLARNIEMGFWHNVVC